MSASASNYRPDIDGLRALAVLSVLVFHAFPGALPGGYTGVDVFFVISGFLITGIIVDEMQRGQFTVGSFYARRIRRIFPALGVVLVFVLVAGWVMLSPSEYKPLEKHVRNAIGFIANFRYLKESLAYFDPSADSKLLLHLWSLAIEEQFYVVWPLLLALAMRLSGRSLALIAGLTAVLGIASLACSIWLTRTQPSAAFYLPWSRAWELMIGGGLAVMQRWRPIHLSSTPAAGVALAGLVLMGIALVSLQKSTPFPGIAALLPTAGAALVILAGPANPVSHHVFANRMAIAIGLISYPLYLWHWPLLSLAHIANAGETAGWVKGVLLVVSGLLAWATYVWLEKPIRRSRRTALTVGGLVVLMLLILAFSLSIKKNQGYPGRPITQLVNGDLATIATGADRGALSHQCGLPENARAAFQQCRGGTEDAPVHLVIGDSKAEALFYGIVRESADKHWALIGSVGVPTPGETGKNQIALETALNTPSVKTVVLVNTMAALFPKDPQSGFIRQPHTAPDATAYEQAISRLMAAGKQVMVVLDNPTLPDPTECIEGGLTASETLNRVLYRRNHPRCVLSYADHVAGTREYREFFIGLQKRHPGLLLADLSEWLCDKAANHCPYVENGNFLYSYSDHISDYAASKAAQQILPLLNIAQTHGP